MLLEAGMVFLKQGSTLLPALLVCLKTVVEASALSLRPQQVITEGGGGGRGNFLKSSRTVHSD